MRALAGWATEIAGPLPLSGAAVADTRRRIIDTLGCILAAQRAEPVAIARSLALCATAQPAASLIGTAEGTTEEWAAFVGGIAARVLEGNDAYPGGGGHPSDAIPALLAVAETGARDGEALIEAVWIAYQLHFRLFETLRLRDHGLDHVLYTAMATAAGVARLLSLPPEQVRHALALALTPNLALHATRTGAISMWKGAAGANAARNGLFAARLAAAGMTGPDAALEGHHGLLELIGPRPLPALLGGEDAMLARACHKAMLCEYHAQSPIAAVLQLGVAAGAVEELVVHTYHFTWSEIGSGAEKWDPRTPEAADHSLPYVLAATIVDGAYDDSIYAPDRLTDPRIRALMPRIRVVEDPAFTARFPGAYPCRLTLRRKDGMVQETLVENPPGHPDNPLGDAGIAAKFRALAGRALTAARVEAALGWLGGLERQPSLAPLAGLLRA
jgi:2-methylcitrate dehydratase